MSTRTICILGGTGFVGSPLAASLAARGDLLRIPTRSATRGRHLDVLPSARVIQADIHAEDTLRRLFDSCDAVVNLVGILNERGRHGAGFRRAHTELTEKAIRAAIRARVPKFVQMSGLMANAEQGPSHYLRTKGEAEAVVRASSPALAWTIVQPSVIFGPGDSFTNRFASVLRLTPGVLPLAMPDARFAPVHVDDVIATLRRAIDDPATDGQTYELCGPEVQTLREIVATIATAIGRRCVILGLPRWASRLQAALMDFVPGKPFSTDNYLSLTVPSICHENGLARLGITPHSFTPRLADWLRPAPRRADRA